MGLLAHSWPTSGEGTKEETGFMPVRKNPAHHSLHRQKMTRVVDAQGFFLPIFFLSFILTKADKANLEPTFNTRLLSSYIISWERVCLLRIGQLLKTDWLDSCPPVCVCVGGQVLLPSLRRSSGMSPSRSFTSPHSLTLPSSRGWAEKE